MPSKDTPPSKLQLRVQKVIDEHTPDLEHRFFFGGPAWFLNGHFSMGLYDGELVVRIGEDAANKLLETNDHTRPMDVTGKPMRGWLFVEDSGCRTSKQVKTWVDRVTGFVSTLPAKKPKVGNKPGKRSKKKATRRR